MRGAQDGEQWIRFRFFFFMCHSIFIYWPKKTLTVLDGCLAVLRCREVRLDMSSPNHSKSKVARRITWNLGVISLL